MASAPSSEADPLSELGNIVSNNTIEEQARLFARYEQEKIDREFAERLARRRSLAPRSPSPRAAAAAPEPVFSRRFIAHQREIMDRIQAQSAANSRPITPRSPPPAASSADDDDEDEEESDSDFSNVTTLSDDRSTAGTTPPSASDPGSSPIVEEVESESENEEEQPSASGPVNSQQNASGAVLRADPSSSGAVLRANNNPSSSSREQPTIPYHYSYSRDRRRNRRRGITDRPLLPRESLRNWTNRVFSEPENVAARPRGILNIGARRSAANQENNEMETARTTDRWGDCTICFSKPSDPMGCISCLQLVGCRLCCKDWVHTTIATNNNASCPLCRKEWGKATEVMPMTAIERRKRMKNN